MAEWKKKNLKMEWKYQNKLFKEKLIVKRNIKMKISIILAILFSCSILSNAQKKIPKELESALNDCYYDNIDKILSENKNLINSENEAGWYPLEIAIFNNCDIDVIKLLIEKYKADVNHYITAETYLEEADTVREGPRTTIKRKKKKLTLPTIITALYYNYFLSKADFPKYLTKLKELLIILIANGADIKAKDQDGHTISELTENWGLDLSEFKEGKIYPQRFVEEISYGNDKEIKIRFYLDNIHYVDSTFFNKVLQTVIIHQNRNEETKIYYYEGNKYREENYKDGVLNGKWIQYANNISQIEQDYEEIEYKMGIKDGEYIKKYNNGNLKVRGQFMNGKKEGKWLYYEPNGRVEEKEYNNDLEITK